MFPMPPPKPPPTKTERKLANISVAIDRRKTKRNLKYYSSKTNKTEELV